MTRAALAGVGLILAGWLIPDWIPGHQYRWLLILTGGAVITGLGVRWWYQQAGSSGLARRWSKRSRRNQGVASAWQILRVSSSWAARRKAKVLRPGLTQRRWLVPIRELATPLARVGWLRVWSPIEDVTLRVGGPRTGKSGELACRVLDAPGAVIATSTRTDLITVTRRIRSRKGPVRIFNPSGIGGLHSTVTFNPVTGCENPTTATARATDLLSATAKQPTGEAEHWLALARQTLAALLHAAALGDLGMWDVRGWIAGPAHAGNEVQKLLAQSPGRVFDGDAYQFFVGMGEKTQASICSTIMPCLAWLTDPHAAAAAQGGGFDVAELLESRGTVYLLGAEEAHTAPLLTALTGHIAREARRIAATQLGGRLDPPLTLVLDEAALICPVPLDKWTADMGGRNVTIHVAAQSRAQLRQRWGPDGAAAIMNNAATLMVFGGTRDDQDLAAYSTLTGERHEDGKTVPVLSPAQIAQLPAGHAVIIRRGMPPVIGRPLMAWQRHDIQGRWLAAAGVLAGVRTALTRRRTVPVPAVPAVEGRPQLRIVPNTEDAA